MNTEIIVKLKTKVIDYFNSLLSPRVGLPFCQKLAAFHTESICNTPFRKNTYLCEEVSFYSFHIRQTLDYFKLTAIASITNDIGYCNTTTIIKINRTISLYLYKGWSPSAV